MKNTRRGLGKGLGMGYKNIAPLDSHIHSLSAKGKSLYLAKEENAKKLIKALDRANVGAGYHYLQPEGTVISLEEKKKSNEFKKGKKVLDRWVKSGKLTKIWDADRYLMAKDINPTELKNELSGFTGTEQYHKVSMTPVVVTDGVKYLCEKAGAFWLIDAIGSYQGEPKFRQEGFQVWILKKDKEGKGAVLSAYHDYSEKNPNKYKPLVTQKIPYTDFPLDEIKLYAIDGVVLLPSEY